MKFINKDLEGIISNLGLPTVMIVDVLVAA